MFGVLQGQPKTGWTTIIPLGIACFVIYYLLFRILISKLNLKTLGRENMKHYKKTDKDKKFQTEDAVAAEKISEDEDKSENTNETANESSDNKSENPEKEDSKENNIIDLEKTEAII